MQTGSKGNSNKENRPKAARAKGEKRAKRTSKGVAGSQVNIDPEVRRNARCYLSVSPLCMKCCAQCYGLAEDHASSVRWNIMLLRVV